MTGRTRHFTIKDGNGKFTTVSIGFETDDLSDSALVDDVIAQLERHFRGIADHHRVEVMHSFTCGHRASAAQN